MLIVKAIEFANDCHAGQLDKVGKDYIYHPLRVMLSLFHESEEVQVVAVLHDVIEDTYATYEIVEGHFGKLIADAVMSVTRIEEPVKELYRDFVARSKANPIGRIVKIADIRDNMLPERMAALPLEEQGIVHRYEKALKFLLED